MDYKKTSIKSNRSIRWKEQKEWENGENGGLIGNVWGKYKRWNVHQNYRHQMLRFWK